MIYEDASGDGYSPEIAPTYSSSHLNAGIGFKNITGTVLHVSLHVRVAQQLPGVPAGRQRLFPCVIYTVLSAFPPVPVLKHRRVQQSPKLPNCKDK